MGLFGVWTSYDQISIKDGNLLNGIQRMYKMQMKENQFRVAQEKCSHRWIEVMMGGMRIQLKPKNLGTKPIQLGGDLVRDDEREAVKVTFRFLT